MDSEATTFVQNALFDFPKHERQEDGYFDRILAALNMFGAAVRQRLALQYAPIRTLSFFSGGGGLDIGFRDSGFHMVEMVELEAKYAKTLSADAKPGGYLDWRQ